jgi:hypothetical protein
MWEAITEAVELCVTTETKNQSPRVRNKNFWEELNVILSFYITRTEYKTEKLGRYTHTHAQNQVDITRIMTEVGRIHREDRQTSKVISWAAFYFFNERNRLMKMPGIFNKLKIYVPCDLCDEWGTVVPVLN